MVGGLSADYHGITLQTGFCIEHAIVHLCRSAVLKLVVIADIAYRSIEQEIALTEDQHVVEQRLYVVHLMGRDDQDAVDTPTNKATLLSFIII